MSSSDASVGSRTSVELPPATTNLPGTASPPYAARRAVQYGDGWYALTGVKYGDEFAFIPKFQDMLANAGA
jgi:hypothetical protein